jgi:cytosine/adenosine deaminase-related metal-dependent hydrolase
LKYNHLLNTKKKKANLQAINFTADDIFWGQLGGCLEALDAGTTCVVDNAHMSAGPDHGSAALAATVASGIRSIFCYGATPLRAAEWTPSTFEVDKTGAFPVWMFDQLEEFAQKSPFGGDGRVQLGFFFDSYFLPQDMIASVFDRVRKMGVRMITSHFRHWSVSEGQFFTLRKPRETHMW